MERFDRHGSAHVQHPRRDELGRRVRRSPLDGIGRNRRPGRKARQLEKVYAIGYKSCSYDAAGKLPPKSEDLVARLTKANVVLSDTLLWWVAGGIDAIELIAKAVAESGSTDSAGIIAYWNTLSKYPGYFGNYTFSPTQHNGYPTEEIVMSEASTAKNGTFALAPGYS